MFFARIMQTIKKVGFAVGAHLYEIFITLLIMQPGHTHT